MIKNELKNILLDTGYFEDNEYLTAYVELVSKDTIDTSGYSEKHHVIPVAVYNYGNKCKSNTKARKIADTDSKNYTVLLLYKDHVLAHYFLYFCTTGMVKKAMGRAIICMLGNFGVDKLDLSEFKYLPEQFEKIQQLIDQIYSDPNNSFYTPYEIEFLKLYYSENGPEWCAAQLNRPVKLIRAKAHRLRLKINNRGDWLDSEVAILKQYYEEQGLKYCLKLLPNRSEAAISCAARKLGLATRRR